jgi:thiamine biosynthesis lipoprotein
MIGRLEQHGIRAALIEAGGDIYALGERPADLVARGADRRWGIGVQDPRYPDDPTRLYTALRVRDQAVVTSGHYHRGYMVAGKRFSHIVDPRTGQPVDTHLASVTIVAPDAALADGLATAVEVLGLEKGKALLESLENVDYLLLESPPQQGGPGPAPTVVGPESAPTGPEMPLEAYRSAGFAALEYSPAAPKGDR